MFGKNKIAVLGAGNMGTAVAHLIGINGHQVNLWNYEGDLEPLEQIAEFHENKKYSPGIKLSENILPEKDLKTAVGEADLVFFCVPSHIVEQVAKRAAEFLKPKVICIDMSKGFGHTLEIIPDAISRTLPKQLKAQVVTISGPAIANEMAKGCFTAMNIASKSTGAIKAVKKVLENKNLKLIPTKDIIGLEVVGASKNVYAIASGLCDGLGFSINTKAAMMVLALMEVSRLAKKMGGQAETAYDLSGLGDIMGTGLCTISRNRRFGELLGGGLTKEKALLEVGQVVEGANAAKALVTLGRNHKIKMPLAELVFRIVWQEASPKNEFQIFLENFEKAYSDVARK